jgi:hypothetical protein
MSLEKRIEALENAQATPPKTLTLFTLEDRSRVYPDTPEARALANGQAAKGFTLGGLIVLASAETLEGLVAL